MNDLRDFLRERAEPTHQFDIIKVVGDTRHKKYPTLLRPWGDVWKSLEYHQRNNNEIVCVEWRGERLHQSKIKRRPHQPRAIGGREDSPELYRKPDNLFWFKAEIASARRRK